MLRGFDSRQPVQTNAEQRPYQPLRLSLCIYWTPKPVRCCTNMHTQMYRSITKIDRTVGNRKRPAQDKVTMSREAVFSITGVLHNALTDGEDYPGTGAQPCCLQPMMPATVCRNTSAAVSKTAVVMNKRAREAGYKQQGLIPGCMMKNM